MSPSKGPLLACALCAGNKEAKTTPLFIKKLFLQVVKYLLNSGARATGVDSLGTPLPPNHLLMKNVNYQKDATWFLKSLDESVSSLFWQLTFTYSHMIFLWTKQSARCLRLRITITFTILNLT
jgi:hypothetical protein